MPIPFHCIECDKPTQGNNKLCNNCNKKGTNMANRLKDAESILNQISIDIDEYFSKNGKVSKSTKSTKVKIDKSSKPATCKYCNGDGFYWSDTQWGWRLFDSKGEQHMCKSNNNDN